GDPASPPASCGSSSTGRATGRTLAHIDGDPFAARAPDVVPVVVRHLACRATFQSFDEQRVGFLLELAAALAPQQMADVLAGRTVVALLRALIDPALERRGEGNVHRGSRGHDVNDSVFIILWQGVARSAAN